MTGVMLMPMTVAGVQLAIGAMLVLVVKLVGVELEVMVRELVSGLVVESLSVVQMMAETLAVGTRLLKQETPLNLFTLPVAVALAPQQLGVAVAT